MLKGMIEEFEGFCTKVTLQELALFCNVVNNTYGKLSYGTPMVEVIRSNQLVLVNDPHGSLSTAVYSKQESTQEPEAVLYKDVKAKPKNKFKKYLGLLDSDCRELCVELKADIIMKLLEAYEMSEDDDKLNNYVDNTELSDLVKAVFYAKNAIEVVACVSALMQTKTPDKIKGTIIANINNVYLETGTLEALTTKKLESIISEAFEDL